MLVRDEFAGTATISAYTSSKCVMRWIGKEKGMAGETNWCTVDPDIVRAPGNWNDRIAWSLNCVDQNGTAWRPDEADVSIRLGCFYHTDEDSAVRTSENLVDLYFRSVGRNATMLLNIPPTPAGAFYERDVSSILGFRAHLDRIFARNLLTDAKIKASNGRHGDDASAPQNTVDGLYQTYRATDDDVAGGNIEATFPQPRTIGSVPAACESAIGCDEYIST